MIAAKAVGNAVQRTTRAKMSQTWLASQTGPIERSIGRATALGPSPRAGEQVPEAGAEVGATEDRVERDAGAEDHRADVGVAHADASVGGGRGRRAVGQLAGSAPGPRASAASSARRATTATVPSPA